MTNNETPINYETFIGQRGIFTNNSKGKQYFLEAKNFASLAELLTEKDFNAICEFAMGCNCYEEYVYLDIDFAAESFKWYSGKFHSNLPTNAAEKIINSALRRPEIKSPSRTIYWFKALAHALDREITDTEAMSVFKLNRTEFDILEDYIALYLIEFTQTAY